MLSATRRWFSRNRTPIAIGVGVVGTGYLAAQYLVSKIRDGRERLSGERIAKENLRRRFEQNQEDCTFTVLALLPTATSNILEAMNTEKITLEIQQIRGARGSVASLSASAPPSIADTNFSMTDDDGTRSLVSLPSLPGEGAAGRAEAQSTTAGGGSWSLDPVPEQGEQQQRAARAEQAASEPGTEGGDASSGSAPSAAVPMPTQKRKTKRQLWDELAISSITRAFTLIYTLALLTLLTRIQLNLLGRRSYLSSVVSLATGPAQAPISLQNHDDDSADHAYGGDFQTNRRYLTFSWWLLNRGWISLRDRVEIAVRRAFDYLSPRDTLSLAEFMRLTTQVREEVEGSGAADSAGYYHNNNTSDGRSRSRRRPPPPEPSSSNRWLDCLLPPLDQEDFVLCESGILDEASPTASAFPSPSSPLLARPAAASSSPNSSPTPAPSLRYLLDETADLIESVPFAHVLALLLDAGFSLLLEQKLATAVFGKPVEEDAGQRGVVAAAAAAAAAAERRVLLPKMLSVLTRQAHAIGNGVPNEYLQEMERVRELESFAAVVYSSNWENEIRAYGGGSDGVGGVGREDDAGSVRRPAAVGEAPAANASAAAGLGVLSSWSVVVPPESPSVVLVERSQVSMESAWERARDKR